MRVAILSPSHALRVGLHEMLHNRAGLRVAAEGGRLEDLNLREIEVLVLASVSLPRRQDLPAEAPALLFLSDDPDAIQGLPDLGLPAWGAIPSSSGAEELIAAVRAVGEGLWVGAPGLVRSLFRPSGQPGVSDGEPPVESLTAREKEVLQAMATGLANKQIALRLGISEHTVKFHLSSLYAKLNAASRTEAVKRGLGLGLISL